MAPHTDTPLRLILVAPIGTRETVALACPGGVAVRADEAIYPPSLRDALRTTRFAFDLGLREAAFVLKLSPSDLSRLERGEVTLSADDWCRAWQALAADWTRRNGHGGRMENLGGDHG